MAGANAIRAGGAVVEVSLKDNVRAGLKAVAARIETFASQVNTAGLSLAASGTAILGAATFAAKSFANAGSEINDFSERTGVAAENASGLKFALEQSGSSLGDLEAGLRKMGKVLTEAQEGSEGAAMAFTNIGLSVDDLIGLRPEQRLAKIADAISGIEDPATRGAYAMDIFGKTGTMLLPALSRGAKGLEEMQARAEQLGLVFTGDAAKAADTLGDAIDEVKAATMGAVNALGGALAPVATEVARAISGAVAGFSRMVKQNPEVVASVAKFAAGVVVAGTGLVALAVAIKGVFAAGALLSALVSPIGIVAGAAAGLGVAVLAIGGAFDGAKRAGETTLGDIAGEVNSTIGDIVSALQAGDLAGAAELALGAVKYVFDSVLAKIMGIWDRFTATMAETFVVISNAAKSVVDWMQTTVAKGITKLANATGTDKLILGVELDDKEVEGSIDNLNKQREAYTKQLEQDTLDRIALIEKESQAEQDRINAQLKASKEKLANVRREVAERRDADLLANAQYGPDASLASQIEQKIAVDIPELGQIADVAERAVGSRGTFFGGDIAALDGGSIGIQKQIAKSAEETAKNTKKILDSMGDGEGIGA